MGRPKKKQTGEGHQDKKDQASAAWQAALEETRKELAGGKTKDLFGDDADVEAVKGSGFSFKLNQEYARDYEAEKQRKEFESLRARHEIEEDSSEDTEEDEDGVLLDPASDLRIHEALLAIKRGEKDAAAEQISSVNTTVKSHLDSILKGKESIVDSKKYTLKDYMRDALTTKTAEEIADLEKDEEEALAKKARDAMTPKEEEEAARQAFLKATEEDEGDYVVQKKENRDAKIDRMLNKVQVTSDTMTLAEKESKVNAQLAQLFQDADTSDKNELFLRNYFLNQGWQKEQVSDDESMDDEDLKDEMDAEMEDDEFDEAQKKFEKEYREVEHHHMEEGACEIIAHPRGHLIKDTLRKATNPRREARLRKKERETQEKIRRDEGVKRLKHLKRQQMDEKIQQIEAIAGKAPEDLLDLAEFDEDFDPDTWDAKMDKVFNQDFYEADDDSFDPSELGSDDDLSLSSDDSSSDSSDSEDRAAREAKRQKQISQSAAKKAGKKGGAPAEAEEEAASETAAAAAAEPAKKKKAKKESVTALTAEEKKELQKKKRQILKQMEEQMEREMEEYNKLDYEDVVAGQKVRFKYKSVPSETFGLTDEDIFTIDDRNLNSIAPLKFYAPYRSKQDNMRDRYIAQENRKTVHIDPEAGPARKSGKYRSGLAPVEFAAVKSEEGAPAAGGDEAKKEKKSKKKGQAKEEGAAAAAAPAAAPAADADAKAAKKKKKKKEKRPREEAEGTAAAAAAATAPPAAKKVKKEKKEMKEEK